MAGREPANARTTAEPPQEESREEGRAGGKGGEHSAETLLKNVLLLQHQAVRAMAEEFHQQTEAFVQQHAWHPLSRKPTAAAHEDKIELRDLPSVTDSDANTLSELVVTLTRANCDAQGRLTAPEQLARFVTAAKNEMKTQADRLQALFILDATLYSAHRSLKKKKKHKKSHQPSRERASEMLSRFETEQGYEMLVDWFATSCSYKDEINRGFTEVLLRTLQRNPPTLSFSRKTILTKLKSYPRYVQGKPNKDLLQTVLDQYREANAHP